MKWIHMSSIFGVWLCKVIGIHAKLTHYIHTRFIDDKTGFRETKFGE